MLSLQHENRNMILTSLRHYAGALLFAFAIMLTPTHATELSSAEAEDFISCLCYDSPDLLEYVDSNYLESSGRLGINYSDVSFKFLIGHDLDPETKRKVRNGTADYDLTVTDLGEGYSRLLFSMPKNGINKEFFFRNGKLIVPSSYHTRNWRRFESEYFEFVVSDTSRINQHAVARLEDFVEEVFEVFEFEPHFREQIRRFKIEYVLCRDSDEVGEVVGHESRGMYELASDRIVTCFPVHYHELVHLLINYRLQYLPLYTHPLLQEGIAVALGGRGGKEANVMAELGSYLVNSGICDISEMLSYHGFLQMHPSISYPVSGLYARFLLDELGSSDFLELYWSYSGTKDQVKSMRVDTGDLPQDQSFHQFCAASASNHLIKPATLPEDSHVLYGDAAISVAEDEDNYLIAVTDTLFIGRSDELEGFRSRKIEEFFTSGTYGGEKYAITVGPEEIHIYNLYTDNLIASLVCGFRSGLDTIPRQNGRYEFAVKKSVLPDLPQLLYTR